MMMNESYRRERGDFTDEQGTQRTADEQVRFFGTLESFARWRKRHDVNALGAESIAHKKSGQSAESDSKAD